MLTHACHAQEDEEMTYKVQQAVLIAQLVHGLWPALAQSFFFLQGLLGAHLLGEDA